MMDRSTNAPHRRRLPVATCVFTLLLGFSSLEAAQVEDRIVAVVNSDLIMMSEMKRELAPERERLKKLHRGQELARRIKIAESMALTTMIERKIQLQEAKARGVEVSDQEVKQTIKQMKLQGEKIDETDAWTFKNIRDQLTLLRLVDREVRSGVMVVDTDMRRYYQEHRDRFALPEEYTLSQILLERRSSDDGAAAKARAREIIAMLKQGETFEDLALRYSEGPNASRGGALGLVRQGELLPAIERAIANLEPGGISDLIDAPEGIHIVRVEEKQPKQFRPYEAVKTEIQGLVFQQKSEDVFQAWLANLKNKAYIEVKFEPAASGQPTGGLSPLPSPMKKE
ncbi:MAG TPA: peptidyl-prolyl cis-trans isomerase [Nitrospiraceae bacterium]